MLFGWTALTCFEFLPSMHERYDYPALILLYAFALCCQPKWTLPTAVFHFCTTMTYLRYLYHVEVINTLLPLLALAYLTAYGFVTYWMLSDFVNRGKGET